MADPDPQNIAAQLRDLMQLWGDPTQEEVAKRLGVRREYVSRILNGLEPSEQLKRAIHAMLQHERAKAGTPADPAAADRLAQQLDEAATKPPGDLFRMFPPELLEMLVSIVSDRLHALARGDQERLAWLLSRLMSDWPDWLRNEPRMPRRDLLLALASLSADPARWAEVMQTLKERETALTELDQLDRQARGKEQSEQPGKARRRAG